MGEDWSCGCRVSMGHWFLCQNHEFILLVMLEEDEEKDEKEETIT